jgi:hypothetical protein
MRACRGRLNPICVNGFIGECLASTSALKLMCVGFIGRQFLSAAEAETAPYVLCFCGDPRHRAQLGSAGLGAKGLLYIG